MIDAIIPFEKLLISMFPILNDVRRVTLIIEAVSINPERSVN